MESFQCLARLRPSALAFGRHAGTVDIAPHWALAEPQTLSRAAGAFGSLLLGFCGVAVGALLVLYDPVIPPNEHGTSHAWLALRGRGRIPL